MEFRKKVLISFQDYMDFNYYQARKRLIMTPVFYVIFAFLMVYIMGTSRLGENWAVLLSDPYIYWVFGLTLLIIILFDFFHLKYSGKKLYNTNRMMRAESDIILNNDGYHETNEFGNTSLGWRDIYKAAESKKAFYIYVSKRQGYIIPKSLTEEQENEVIRSLIKEHLPPSKFRLL